MKFLIGSLTLLGLTTLAGCETKDKAPVLGDSFYLGSATEANIKVLSIRDPDQPNERSIIGEASGERAVTAIDKLNSAKASGATDAAGVSPSGGR